jgi:hypothetical protein
MRLVPLRATARLTALRTSMLLATRPAALILMLAILGEGGWNTCDKADNRGRNKKFAHQIRPHNRKRINPNRRHKFHLPSDTRCYGRSR